MSSKNNILEGGKLKNIVLEAEMECQMLVKNNALRAREELKASAEYTKGTNKDKIGAVLIDERREEDEEGCGEGGRGRAPDSVAS